MRGLDTGGWWWWWEVEACTLSSLGAVEGDGGLSRCRRIPAPCEPAGRRAGAVARTVVSLGGCGEGHGQRHVVRIGVKISEKGSVTRQADRVGLRMG